MLGNFACFFVFNRFFSKLMFLKILFESTIRVSNSLDQDQDPHNVGPDLDPNCLQRSTPDDKSHR